MSSDSEVASACWASGPTGAARCEESLRALYEEHAAVLLAYSLRLTDGDRARAEDVVQ